MRLDYKSLTSTVSDEDLWDIVKYTRDNSRLEKEERRKGMTEGINEAIKTADVR